MSESASDTAKQRLDAAQRLDEAARLMLLSVPLCIVMGSLGWWILREPLIPVIALCLALGVLVEVYSLRNVARGMRGEPTSMLKRTALLAISLTCLVVALAGMGYLIGGWAVGLLFAILLTLVLVSVVAVSWLRLTRRQRDSE
jgi:hypothetical protein